MKKDSIRWKISACILIFIICSPLHVTVASFTVSVNALLLSVVAFIGIALYSIWKKLYSLLSALIIAMLYTSFHLLEVYDPIWIVVDRLFLLSSALVYASVLLHEDRILRLCSLYIGMLQGELFVTLIFRKLHFPYDYGSLSFLISSPFLHCSWQFCFGLQKHQYTWNSSRGKHVKERRG